MWPQPGAASNAEDSGEEGAQDQQSAMWRQPIELVEEVCAACSLARPDLAFQ
jgi:hypothetical protein